MNTESSVDRASKNYNIGENLYHSLRKNIVNLNLKPGEALNVKSIAEKLGVSRTPVRDAFRHLEKEGLVDVVPQVGSSVSRIDIGRVHEERFIRMSLEEKAIGLFMLDPHDEAIAHLEANLHRQRACVTQNDILAFLELDDDFHGTIFYSTGKRMSWDLIQSMSGHYRRVRIMSLWDRNTLSDVLRQHEAIHKGLVEKKVPEVDRLIDDHFTRIFSEERSLMENYPDYFKETEAEDFLVKDYLAQS
jgi:DNA-binding GntR family transcriptional regulator